MNSHSYPLTLRDGTHSKRIRNDAVAALITKNEDTVSPQSDPGIANTLRTVLLGRNGLNGNPVDVNTPKAPKKFIHPLLAALRTCEDRANRLRISPKQAHNLVPRVRGILDEPTDRIFSCGTKRPLAIPGYFRTEEGFVCAYYTDTKKRLLFGCLHHKQQAPYVAGSNHPISGSTELGIYFVPADQVVQHRAVAIAKLVSGKDLNLCT